MLNWLVRSSLRYRIAVLAGAFALMIFGIVATLRSPLDVFPEFAPPFVEVQVEAPGMSSEAVERLITIPLESHVNGVPQMTVLRSKSVQGLASVQVYFERGTDIFQARQMVMERVNIAARQLPQLADVPIVMPPLSSTSRTIKLGLTSRLENGVPVLSPAELSAIMKWMIEPAVRAVPGVSNVSTYGQNDKQYQILVKPAELREHGVTLEQVKQAAREAVVYGSAGFHDTPNQRLAMQYTTRIDSPLDLGQTVVAHRNGDPILLHQVATLTSGIPAKIGEGVVNDRPGLLCVVEKFPWANTLEVTRKVEAVVANLRPSLPNVEISTKIFRPATFIETALGNLQVAMLIGCVLVALIVVAFLFEWRSAVISLTAIPLSIITALLVLYYLGGTLNTMVLAGLAIAIGEVVDDAIIDVENIVRRLRQRRGESAFRVVLEASIEVRSAVVFATFIVAFVCMPIFFMEGVAGAFFRPLATAYILAVLASLLVALTVTPAMALMLLPQAVPQREESRLSHAIRGIYRRLLPLLLTRPAVLIAATILLFAGAVAWYPQFKKEYLPQFQETDFLMHWIAKPGTSIDTVNDNIIRVSKEMRAEPKTGVKEFGAHTARAYAGEEVVGPHFAELWISLGEFKGDYFQARKEIEAVMANHPGFQHDLLTYLQERIKEVLTGTGASVVLRIYGDDLATLRRKADEVYSAISGINGVIDLKKETQVLVPQIELVVDPYRAAAHGLTPRAIFTAVRTLVNGERVGQVHQGAMIFDLVVWGHPDIRSNLQSLRKLEIDLPSGKGTVPLEAVAQLHMVNAQNTIRHDKASRCIDVSCNVSGDLGGVVQEIKKRIEPLKEDGYRIEVQGEYQAREENLRQLVGVGILAFFGIALMLYMDFQSIRLTALVLITTLFALIGGVAAVGLTGGVVSLGSLVGFITVLGIAARNGIMMVSHYRHLELHEGMPFGRELILRGAQERVVPVLMTALAAGLGLLPLAISGNKPGYEVEYPMAVVILGGLFTSTLLNLGVLPVLYEKLGKVPPPADEEVGKVVAAAGV